MDEVDVIQYFKSINIVFPTINTLHLRVNQKDINVEKNPAKYVFVRKGHGGYLVIRRPTSRDSGIYSINGKYTFELEIMEMSVSGPLLDHNSEDRLDCRCSIEPQKKKHYSKFRIIVLHSQSEVTISDVHTAGKLLCYAVLFSRTGTINRDDPGFKDLEKYLQYDLTEDKLLNIKTFEFLHVSANTATFKKKHGRKALCLFLSDGSTTNNILWMFEHVRNLNFWNNLALDEGKDTIFSEIPRSFLKHLVEDLVRLDRDEEVKRGKNATKKFMKLLNNLSLFALHTSLNTKSFVMEFFRSSGYKKSKGEKCVCVTVDMNEKLVEKLGYDILTHCTLTDESIHALVSRQLKIPSHVLKETLEFRTQFYEKYQESQQKKAAMRVLGYSDETVMSILRQIIPNSASSVPDSPHLYTFEIDEQRGDLKVIAQRHSPGSLPDVKLLEVRHIQTDPFHQACLPVYMRPTDVYMVVIDGSKRLDDRVTEGERGAVKSSFQKWTQGDYFMHWLQTLHTYCNEKTQIIFVATCGEEIHDSCGLYKKISQTLPEDSMLKAHVSQSRCFVLGNSSNCEVEIKKCIAEMAVRQCNRRDAVSPTIVWLEMEIHKNAHIDKVISRERLKYTMHEIKESDICDSLRFLHGIGNIIFFDENVLRNIIIVDVMWFAESFKNLIVDVHGLAQTRKDEREITEMGIVHDSLIDLYWSPHKNRDMKCNKHAILSYMQRLGLIAVSQNQSGNHFIPFANIHDYQDDMDSYDNRTPDLIFKFQHLPHFFFPTFIQGCMAKWKVLKDTGKPLLYNKAVFFDYGDHIHNIRVASDKVSIKFQVFSFEHTLDEFKTAQIGNMIKEIIKTTSAKFHQETHYEVGFSCDAFDLTNDDYSFLNENAMKAIPKGRNPCPLHPRGKHRIDRKDFLKYWVKDTTPASTTRRALRRVRNMLPRISNATDTAKETGFQDLLDLALEALQLYFDGLFPPDNFETFLKTEKSSITGKGTHFKPDERNKLFSESVKVTSGDLDVTILYKIIRNYGNLPEPGNGWGKQPCPYGKEKSDDIERVRYYRNMFTHKSPGPYDVTATIWLDLAEAIERLSDGDLKGKVNEVSKSCPVFQTSIQDKVDKSLKQEGS